MLRAGVMDEGSVRRPVTGTPQGGVVSPLLANIYLHRVDRSWDVARHGVLVRYADDLVVMCRSRGQTEAALEQLRFLLAGLGLEPKPVKTRIVHLQVGGEGFDFLGFHHRLVRSQGWTGRAGVTFLARWPAKKAMQHARQRVRELTDRSRLLLPVDWVTEQVNRFRRGWVAYFLPQAEAATQQWHAGFIFGGVVRPPGLFRAPRSWDVLRRSRDEPRPCV
jgi:hypothetical protein